MTNQNPMLFRWRGMFAVLALGVLLGTLFACPVYAKKSGDQARQAAKRPPTGSAETVYVPDRTPGAPGMPTRSSYSMLLAAGGLFGAGVAFFASGLVRRSNRHRKTYVRTLRQKEDLFAAAFQGSLDGSGVISLENGWILEVNSTLESMLGLTRDDIVGRTPRELGLVRDRVQLLQLTSRLFNGEAVHGVEVHLALASGGLLQAQFSATPLQLEEESCALFTLRDISGERLVQENLRESEHRYRTIVESPLQGIVVIDGDLRIKLTNRRFDELLGWEKPIPEGTDFRRFVAAEDLPVVTRRHILRRQGRDVPSYYSFRLERQDGSRVVVEVYAALIETGEGTRETLLQLVDLTARRDAEEALRRSEERFRLLFEQSVEPIYVRRGNRFRLVSPRFEELFGYSATELIRPDFDFLRLFAPAQRAEAERSMERVASSGGAIHRETLIGITRDGREITLEIIASAIEWDDGPAVLGFMRDVTDRKKLEEQLLQAQKMESIGQLAGGVAHDFNNLLTGISGYTELARYSLERSHPVCRELDEIQRIVEHASTLTRQLLAFSRKQVLQPRVVNLNQVLDSVQPMLRRLIGENIELVVVPNPDLGNVRVDPIQIEQVILNLVVNARDAMPEGGSLTLETGNETTSRDRHTPQGVLRAGDYVKLTVRDTGHGIPEELLGRIFEPFFTTKDKGKGTGLGLSTVHGIVQQSDGFLETHSTPVEGTTFQVYLPRVREPVKSRPGSASPDEFPRGDEHILVVEDEKPVRNMVVRMLSSLGYRITEAKNASDALAAVQQDELAPDLVISDVVMPGMSGPELLEELRQHTPNVRILLMSGYAFQEISRYRVDPESTPFLHKPFRPSALAVMVRSVLDGLGSELRAS